MEIAILGVASVILICLVANKLSNKLGVPTLLVFIFLGMLFGSDGFFKIQFDNYNFAEQICSVALIFIMFYGGFGTNWKSAKSVAPQSILLSSVGVIVTAMLVGLFCHIALGFNLLEGMLVGAVISSTDAASVFSILRSKKLNLKYGTASILEIESGSNDPFAYMFTILILSLMNGEGSIYNIVRMVFAQLIYGIIVGVAVAVLTSIILKNSKKKESGFESMLVFSVSLFSYALSTMTGGNGYLSTYITGIILGNSSIKNKKTLVHFFDGITGLMQILIFFLLGLLSFPSNLPNIALTAIIIAVFLTVIARPLAVSLILTPFKCPIKQQLLVSWSGLRGASSIVFIIMATLNTNSIENDVFNTVFFIVLFSIALQGTLIPFVSKKLNMIDNSNDVMKTFNDYTEEVSVQFLRSVIDKKHPWVNKKIKDISLPPDMIIVLIIRNRKRIVPNGNTVIMESDIVVFSGIPVDDRLGGNFLEINSSDNEDWLGKSLSEIDFHTDKLVILIKRNDKVVIPTGNTVIKKDDVLIINN